MLLQFYAMQSPEMLEHPRIISKFRQLYGGAHVFIQVLSAPFGQHQGLVNVTSFLPVHLVLFYVRWLWLTSISCILRECCWWELLTFGCRNPSFLVHYTRNPSSLAASDNILYRNSGLQSSISLWSIEVISPKLFNVCLVLHPPWLCATTCSMFPIVLLHLIL